jgi:hypothetical protein
MDENGIRDEEKCKDEGRGTVPDCVVEQTHRVNALRQAIGDISGCFDQSKHVWITLLLCRYLTNRLRKYYVSTRDLAACGWMVYQTICALYLIDHGELSDEQCADKVGEAVSALFGDGRGGTAPFYAHNYTALACRSGCPARSFWG